MGMVALTRVVHGEDDGSRTEFAPGDEVKGLDKEVLEELVAAGAVGEPPASQEEVQDLQAKIAQLQAELAAARGEGSVTSQAEADKAAKAATQAPTQKDADKQAPKAQPQASSGS